METNSVTKLSTASEAQSTVGAEIDDKRSPHLEIGSVRSLSDEQNVVSSSSSSESTHQDVNPGTSGRGSSEASNITQADGLDKVKKTGQTSEEIRHRLVVIDDEIVDVDEEDLDDCLLVSIDTKARKVISDYWTDP